jgi:AAA domain, putative AbiEii toxin, Type IV TA system
VKVTSVRLQKFRSFNDSGSIELGQLNVLIGANNSGKSSILRGLHQIQQGLDNIYGDVRVGSQQAQIDIELTDIAITSAIWGEVMTGSGQHTFSVTLNSNGGNSGVDYKLLNKGNSVKQGDLRLPNFEPNHFVVPFLSKRRTASYSEDIREQQVKLISSDMSTLPAKLTRLANPEFPTYKQYAEACKAILGFVVTNIPSSGGQLPGIYLPNQATVAIDQMGDGVPNIVHLLASLAVSEGKLFLVEEPENDLHPFALKALLDLIILSSKYNQFVVSTHSNIVVSHICSVQDSRLFRVSSERGHLPTEATVERIPPTPEARMSVLQELGYAFSDFDLWDGWLILEESSAERIIRDYLVPWFAPSLTRVRTLSAGGVTKVEAAFKDFHRMMLFVHLQPAYAGRAWVRVDGDDPGRSIVDSLRTKFPSWDPNRFNIFSETAFEYYYPAEFRNRSDEVLQIKNKETRREAKRKLLEDVMAWLDADPERGKTALKESAESVIQDLQKIEVEFLAPLQKNDPTCIVSAPETLMTV